VAGNVNLAMVKQALGHRSISSTMVYICTSDQQASQAVQAALMRVFSRPPGSRTKVCLNSHLVPASKFVHLLCFLIEPE
jgi:hypothetical protein